MITLLQDIFSLSPLTRERELYYLILKILLKKWRFPNYSTYWYFTYILYMFITYKGSMITPCKTTLKLPNPIHNGLLMYWTVGAPGVDPPVSQEDRSFSTDHDRQGCERESSSLIKRPVVWGQIHSHCASFTFSSFKE